MKKDQFYKLLGDIDEKNIKAVEQPIVKKKHTWIKYIVPFAACLLLVLGISFNQISRNNPLGESSTSEQEIAIEHKNINIYYVNNNELFAVSEYLPCSAEEVFKSWKKANNIGNEVELIHFEIKNNGTERKDSFTASYTVGDSFTMKVTVTENLKNYYSVIPENILLKSLKLTLTEYHNIDFDKYQIFFE